MTASIETPQKGGQFIDRFLAFFAGAAIAVWFLGGLNASSDNPISLAGPETQVVANLTSESSTVLTRMGEELIVQVASTFETGPNDTPFATIGEDGQVRVLSIEALGDIANTVQSTNGTGPEQSSGLVTNLASHRTRLQIRFDDEQESATVKASESHLTASKLQTASDSTPPPEESLGAGMGRPSSQRAGPRSASNFIA